MAFSRRVLVFAVGIAPIGAIPVRELAHSWRHVDNKYWQVEGVEGEAADVTDAREKTRGGCGPGMVEVNGKYHATPGEGDSLQKDSCKNWINRDFPERCAEFDQDKWHQALTKFPTKEMRFCIDRFEYPNKLGAHPWIVIDFYSAAGVCKSEGKRLCSEVEWTFACEGEEGLPYPYGAVRDKNACVVDRTWRQFYGAFLPGNPIKLAIAELDYLWQGEPSGSRPRCKSPFGVYDMIGNVDEWTTSSYGGRKSILKGGYWGPVRTRCRPSTRAHNETHAFYQQGFRCCKDAGANAAN